MFDPLESINKYFEEWKKLPREERGGNNISSQTAINLWFSGYKDHPIVKFVALNKGCTELEKFLLKIAAYENDKNAWKMHADRLMLYRGEYFDIDELLSSLRYFINNGDFTYPLEMINLLFGNPYYIHEKFSGLIFMLELAHKKGQHEVKHKVIKLLDTLLEPYVDYSNVKYTPKDLLEMIIYVLDSLIDYYEVNGEALPENLLKIVENIVRLSEDYDYECKDFINSKVANPDALPKTIFALNYKITKNFTPIQRLIEKNRNSLYWLVSFISVNGDKNIENAIDLHGNPNIKIKYLLTLIGKQCSWKGKVNIQHIKDLLNLITEQNESLIWCKMILTSIMDQNKTGCIEKKYLATLINLCETLNYSKSVKYVTFADIWSVYGDEKKTMEYIDMALNDQSIDTPQKIILVNAALRVNKISKASEICRSIVNNPNTKNIHIPSVIECLSKLILAKNNNEIYKKIIDLN